MENEEPREHCRTAVSGPIAGQGTDAGDIPTAIVSTWQRINASLCPIIGRGGVVALYKRSLRLVGTEYPWFAGAHEGVEMPLDFAALKSVLAQQSSATAAAGGDALIHAFCSLLTSLVGLSLTEKVLGFACSSASGSLPVQENSP